MGYLTTFYSFLTTLPSFQNLTFFAFWRLASLKMLIERQEGSEEAPGVLTLSELVKFYQCKLKEVGAQNGKTNATRLRERVLDAVPDLTAHPEGRQVILASRHDIGGILTEAKRN